MSDLDLDFSFGWRWLLHDKMADNISCCGLSGDEIKWWQSTYSKFHISSHNQNADGCMLALDRSSLHDAINMINATNPRWICAWGSGRAVSALQAHLEGFIDLRQYALLPAANPRVVVPLSSPVDTEAGLRLHRPGRLVGRFALIVARVLAQFGNHSLLRGKVLLIATRQTRLLPGGAEQAGLTGASEYHDYALYLGTPDDNRKTVVLPLGINSKPLIIKVAETPKARLALQNEAKALVALQITKLNKHTPSLVGLEDNGGCLSLLQEYRKRRWVCQRRLVKATAVFLADMAQISRTQVSLAEYLKVFPPPDTKGLSDEVRLASAVLINHLNASAKGNLLLCLHRCHGDFAPWNCSWSQQGLFVFDWEDSREHGLALGDAFYYVLSPLVHVHKRNDAGKALNAAIKFANTVIEKDGAENIDIRIYMALWLLHHLNESPFYSEMVVALQMDWHSCKTWI